MRQNEEKSDDDEGGVFMEKSMQMSMETALAKGASTKMDRRKQSEKTGVELLEGIRYWQNKGLNASDTAKIANRTSTCIQNYYRVLSAVHAGREIDVDSKQYAIGAVKAYCAKHGLLYIERQPVQAEKPAPEQPVENPTPAAQPENEPEVTPENLWNAWMAIDAGMREFIRSLHGATVQLAKLAGELHV